MRAPSIRTMLAGAFAMSLLAITPPGQASVLVGCQGGDFGDDCSLRELQLGGKIRAAGTLFENFASSAPGLAEILVSPFESSFGAQRTGGILYQRITNGTQAPLLSDDNRGAGPVLLSGFNAVVADDAKFTTYDAKLGNVTVGSTASSRVDLNLHFGTISYPIDTFPELWEICEPFTTCFHSGSVNAFTEARVSVLVDLFAFRDSSVDRLAVVFVSSIPEPSSLVIMLAALVVLAALRQNGQLQQ